jgi:hypothetical protein
MHSEDGALTAISYAPCSFEYDGLTVDVTGAYPFEDDVTITVSGSGVVPPNLRIPAWATDATVTVDGVREPAQAGTIHEIRRDWSGDHVIRLHLPAEVRAVPRFNEAITIERGPLVFSLPIGEDWRRVGGEQPHATWEVHPTTAWNYAIDPDQVDLTRRPVSTNPFTPGSAPVGVQVRGRRVPWPVEHGAAAAPPRASADTPLEDLTLIPYGCTKLRVTELPRIAR